MVEYPGYGLDDRKIAIRFAAGGRDISLLQKFQIDYGANPVSCKKSTGLISFPV